MIIFLENVYGQLWWSVRPLETGPLQSGTDYSWNANLDCDRGVAILEANIFTRRHHVAISRRNAVCISALAFDDHYVFYLSFWISLQFWVSFSKFSKRNGRIWNAAFLMFSDFIFEFFYELFLDFFLKFFLNFIFLNFFLTFGEMSIVKLCLAKNDLTQLSRPVFSNSYYFRYLRRISIYYRYIKCFSRGGNV